MKNLTKLLPIIALFVVNSCSFANKSTVVVPVNSNPPGANVVIDGRNFGQTPAFIELKPNKNYKASISKPGYSTVNIDMETWYSVRNGEGGDGGRCMADAVGVLPMLIVLIFAPEKCGAFKQSDYFVNLSGVAPVAPIESAPQYMFNDPNQMGNYGAAQQIQQNQQNQQNQQYQQAPQNNQQQQGGYYNNTQYNFQGNNGQR
ncbi:MAG: hypothetical protein K0R25_548 [Rickettsiaceae bacterium]|jgi:hypothetical protein|nr:hypothetical protein [Rickettsiaceae bacterium]